MNERIEYLCVMIGKDYIIIPDAFSKGIEGVGCHPETIKIA